MSDLPSVPSTERISIATPLAGWINANIVLQKILNSLDAEERSKIVLRCDDLPLLSGREKDFENLFRSLLQMILQKKGEVTTLYLHISCAIDSSLQEKVFGHHYFTIQFNSNIIPCTNWAETNKDLLEKLEAIVEENKGYLSINAFKSSGCIFSVSLPGKVV
ncbi:hypothetical protein HRH25_17565 [Flavisolibacter sp. BT320]|nr:hypothetical protein [Flavisolibacter longurius]